MASGLWPQSSGVCYTTVTTVTDTDRAVAQGLLTASHRNTIYSTLQTGGSSILQSCRLGSGKWGIPPNLHGNCGGHSGCPISYLYGGPGAWCAKGIHEVKCIIGLRRLETSWGTRQIGVPRHKDTIRKAPGKPSARKEGASSQLETRTEGRVPGAGIVWAVSA